MSKNYWLDLFTGKTWEEFLKHGADVSGFRKGRRKASEKIKPNGCLSQCHSIVSPYFNE